MPEPHKSEQNEPTAPTDRMPIPSLGELLGGSPELVAYLRRHDLLRPLLRRNLIANTVRNVSLPEDLRGQLLQQYWQRNQLNTDEARRSHLQDRALGMADLLWQLELQQRIRAYAQQHFGGKAEAHFLKRKGQLDQVVYSLIRVKESYLAREIYLQILEGEANFSDLARRHAQGPERETNGVVATPLGQANPLLADRLRSAEPGQLLEPMAIADWWLVVRLDHRKEASLDEATAQRMAVEVFQEWIDEQLSDRLSRMQRPNTPELRT